MKTKEIMVNSNLNTIGSKWDLDEIEPEIMQRNVFKALRKSGWRQVPWKRHVVLSFDTASCKYLNPKLCEKQPELVPPIILFFAIQIVNTRMFQPVGRVFCQKSVSPSTVASCVKSFIRDLMRCEYFVIATVCRPMIFFRKIIECLVEIHSLDSKVDAHWYKVEFLKIVHFYDPIAMLEQVFLLFLKHSITYKQLEKKLLATYNDCKSIMVISSERDVINDIFKHSNNIICAVRLFSMTFYRTIQNCITEGKLKDTGTAEFIAFFDMLFDTLHGDLDEFTSKLNRKPLSKLSSHRKIWNKFLMILPTMKVLSPPGDLLPGYGYMGKNAETNLVNETVFYEVINTFPKSDVSIDVNRARKNLLQRINELEMESEKLSKDDEENDEDNFKNVQVKYYVDSGCEAEVFEYKGDTDFYVSIDDLNNTTKDKFENVGHEEIQQVVVESAVDKPINLEEYTKNLYFVLRDSECTSVTTYDDYAYTKSSESGNISAYIPENNILIDEEAILMQDYEDCAEFAIRHFDVYLDYLEYFVEETCMYKRTNCIKIILEEEAIQYNSEEYCFTEDDYINESQIAYSDETMIIGEPLDRYADLRMQLTHNDDEVITVTHQPITSAEKGTTTDGLLNDQSQGVNMISDTYFSQKHFNISTVDTVIDILTYVSKRLTADENYTETITDIINYINKFIISPELKLKSYDDNCKQQTTAIYDVIVKMFSKTNADEQKDVYTKADSIQLQLKALVSKYEKLHEQQNKKEGIHSVPIFFNSLNGNLCMKDNDVPTKKYDIHFNFSKMHENMEKRYSKIQKETKRSKDDNPMEVDSEEEKEASNKTDVNYDDDNDFQPYIFDAWQISINGAKKLFEFLQKKRFTSLDMNSLNIDHLRQIIYAFRADRGITVENNHHIKISFIDPAVVADVFEADDAIILD